jgi:GTP-binding protein EngB required for normal cell division
MNTRTQTNTVNSTSKPISENNPKRPDMNPVPTAKPSRQDDHQPTPTSAPTINVLLLGKSGAGKSATINMFANLAADYRFKGQRNFVIPALFKGINGKSRCFYGSDSDTGNDSSIRNNVGESVTREVDLYDIPVQGLIFKLIDTPGFGDTRGLATDRDNSNLIVAALQRMSSIHAIILVSKISENRLSRELLEAINQFKNFLPRGFENNLIVFFTHAGNSLANNAESILKELRIPVENSLRFEYSCLIPYKVFEEFKEKYREDFDSMCNQEQSMWNRNKKNFDKFIATLRNIKPVDAGVVNVFQNKKIWFERLIDRLLKLQSKLDAESGSLRRAQFPTTANVGNRNNPNSYFQNQQPQQYNYIQNNPYASTANNNNNPINARGNFNKDSTGNYSQPQQNQYSNYGQVNMYQEFDHSKKQIPDPTAPIQANNRNQQANAKEEIAILIDAILYLEDMIKGESQTNTSLNFNSITAIDDQILYLNQLKQVTDSERYAKIDELQKLQSTLKTAQSIGSRKFISFPVKQSATQFVFLIISMIAEDFSIDARNKVKALDCFVLALKSMDELSSSDPEEFKYYINKKLNDAFGKLALQNTQPNTLRQQEIAPNKEKDLTGNFNQIEPRLKSTHFPESKVIEQQSANQNRKPTELQNWRRMDHSPINRSSRY